MSKIRARGTDRLLDVLDVVMQQDQPNNRNAIALALGAPRSTVYSVIDILVARGFLDQIDPDGWIVPGRRCGLLGLAYEKSIPLTRLARQVIEDLATATGELAELDVLQDWKQLILISRSGRGHSYRGAAEGTRVPLPWTASARFLLEGVPSADLIRFIPSEDYAPPTGLHSSHSLLLEEIQRASHDGFWVSRGLIAPYLACVTAPVRNRQHRCIAVICLVLPLQQLSGREADYVSMTREAARTLSEACAVLRDPSF